MSETLKQQLRESHDMWFPGDQLTAELISPTPEELRNAFATHVMPGETVVSLEGSLSALTVPAEQPRGYALLDIDDCVADLSGSIRYLQHGDGLQASQRHNNHDYGENMWFDDGERDLKAQLFALMRGSTCGILPASGINEIRDIMASWREQRMYVGFISSQTAGSELPTITNFLGRYFKGACDFLVIPDGHYAVADKGRAAKAILRQWGYDKTTRVVSIDDIPYNTTKLRNAVLELPSAPANRSIQVDFPSHMPQDTDSQRASSPLDAFRKGDAFFSQQHERNLGRISLATL